MGKEKQHCGICKQIVYGEMDQKTGKESDSICKLFNHILSREDVLTIVECNSFERRPHTCASCGTEITQYCRKAKNPLTYHHGPRKGQDKQCCDNPDWRKCPGEITSNCEGEAIICRNCGYYYGLETW
jgi:hypothetical protein